MRRHRNGWGAVGMAAAKVVAGYVVVYVAIVAGVVLASVAVRALLDVTGVRPLPTRENYLRECPRLTYSLYSLYMTEWDRDQTVLVGVVLKSPEGILPERYGGVVLGRTGGFAELRVPVGQLCDLSNAPDVGRIFTSSPPRFP